MAGIGIDLDAGVISLEEVLKGRREKYQLVEKWPGLNCVGVSLQLTDVYERIQGYCEL